METIKKNLEERSKKTIHVLHEELNTVRAGRANPALLDRVMVDYYGSLTPINQMANISVPEARMLVISLWDTSMIKEVNKAILASDLGLTPTDDGKVIRLNFPMLTEERRRELVKQTKKLVEDTKVVCRNARRDAIEALKKLKKDGELAEDAEASLEKEVQKKLDEHSVKIDKMMDEKEKEIMQV
jgi:ribosome recycling factor